MSNHISIKEIIYGNIDRPRGEDQLVCPVTFYIDVEGQVIPILYLVSAKTLDELKNHLSKIHTIGLTYCMSYLEANNFEISFKPEYQTVMEELCKTMSKLPKDMSKLEQKIVEPIDDTDRQEISDLCDEMGIRPLNTEGFNKLTFLVLKESLKRSATKAS